MNTLHQTIDDLESRNSQLTKIVGEQLVDILILEQAVKDYDALVISLIDQALNVSD